MTARRVALVAIAFVGAGALLAIIACVRHPPLLALARYAFTSGALRVPVAGVRPSSLTDSWSEPRSGGRRHQGIDIFARRGTPVVAAAPGEVLRIGDNSLGGHCVWIAGAGARIYYYAHLDRIEPALTVGDSVAAGDTLGFVGTTGNARGTSPHLHFGVYPLSNAMMAVDPFPLLARGRERR